jgi:hypothetical protein
MVVVLLLDGRLVLVLACSTCRICDLWRAALIATSAAREREEDEMGRPDVGSAAAGVVLLLVRFM